MKPTFRAGARRYGWTRKQRLRRIKLWRSQQRRKNLTPTTT